MDNLFNSVHRKEQHLKKIWSPNLWIFYVPWKGVCVGGGGGGGGGLIFKKIESSFKLAIREQKNPGLNQLSQIISYENG